RGGGLEGDRGPLARAAPDRTARAADDTPDLRSGARGDILDAGGARWRRRAGLVRGDRGTWNRGALQGRQAGGVRRARRRRDQGSQDESAAVGTRRVRGGGEGG